MRRFKVSPVAVVAVLSLAVASFCLLYTIGQKGAIAIGSPSPNGIRIIEAGQVYRPMEVGARKGSPATDSCECLLWSSEYDKVQIGRYCACYHVWYHKSVTVPEGKKWIVLVSPTTTGFRSNDPVNFGGKYGLREWEIRPAGFFYWPGRQSGVLEAGQYEEVDLCITGAKARSGRWQPVVYLVLEVDA